MMKRGCELAAAFLVAAACAGCGVGGDDGGGGGGGGATDGGGGGGGIDGGGDTTCLAPTTSGDLGALAGVSATQENQPGSQGARQIYKIDGPLGDSAGTVLHVELYDNRGAFSGGAATAGTYDITGAETSADTCGVCVYLYTDINASTGTPAQVYMAQSGSLTLDGLRPTTSGSVADLSFVQVDPSNQAAGRELHIEPDLGQLQRHPAVPRQRPRLPVTAPVTRYRTRRRSGGAAMRAPDRGAAARARTATPGSRGARWAAAPA